MYLRTLGICVLKYMNLVMLVFLLQQDSMASSLKKEQSKIRSTDMSLMVKRVIRGRIHHAIHEYTKGNNIYIQR